MEIADVFSRGFVLNDLRVSGLTLFIFPVDYRCHRTRLKVQQDSQRENTKVKKGIAFEKV